MTKYPITFHDPSGSFVAPWRLHSASFKYFTFSATSIRVWAFLLFLAAQVFSSAMSSLFTIHLAGPSALGVLVLRIWVCSSSWFRASLSFRAIVCELQLPPFHLRSSFHFSLFPLTCHLLSVASESPGRPCEVGVWDLNFLVLAQASLHSAPVFCSLGHAKHVSCSWSALYLPGSESCVSEAQQYQLSGTKRIVHVYLRTSGNRVVSGL